MGAAPTRACQSGISQHCSCHLGLPFQTCPCGHVLSLPCWCSTVPCLAPYNSTPGLTPPSLLHAGSLKLCPHIVPSQSPSCSSWLPSPAVARHCGPALRCPGIQVGYMNYAAVLPPAAASAPCSASIIDGGEHSSSSSSSSSPRCQGPLGSTG